MTIHDPIVLLVDDSETDVLLMRTIFERAGFVLPLQFAHDGVEAIAYLNGDGDYRDRTRFPLPTVMLLDLNMPRKDGFEVLTWVRQQPALKRLRIYVLSASSRPEDIRRAYDLGANSYLVKPGNLDGLMQMAKILVAWLRRSHFAPLTEIAKDDEPSLAPGSTPRPGTAPAVAPPTVTLKLVEAPPSAREWAWNEVCRINGELETALKKKTAELTSFQAERENIARIIGHDLRTPLMTIGGYVDLLAQGAGPQLDDKGRLYLQKITEATDQLTRMLATIPFGVKAHSLPASSTETRPQASSAA